MLLTEKEAAEKWCPHVRIAVLAGTGGAACNEHPDPEIDAACRCVGSRCAMWRWAEPMRRSLWMPESSVPYSEPAAPAPDRPADVPMSWEWTPAMDPSDPSGGWLEPESEANARRRGYCGLAGKPEER